TERAGGENVIILLHYQRRAAHSARIPGDRTDADRDHDVDEARAERGHDEDREDDAWERHQDVDNPHDRVIDGATEETRDQPDNRTDTSRDGDRDQSHRERDARAINDPAQDIAPQFIGAEEMLPGWWLQQIR